jgi:hypothetical protein
VRCVLEAARLALKTRSSGMTTPRRVLAVLKLPEDQVPLFIIRAQAIVAAMDGNPWFPSPDPPLAALRAAIATLSEAETAMGARKDARADRDEKRDDLYRLLQHERNYVQRIADANTEQAASIIEGAGMFVKKSRPLPARVFEVREGPLSGSAEVIVPVAADRASYEYAHSTDGMKTWIEHPSSTRSTFPIDGLTPGSTVWFRYRASVKGQMGDYSDAVSLIVR